MASLQQSTLEARQVEHAAPHAEQITVTRATQDHDLRNYLYLVASFAQLLHDGQFGAVTSQQQEFLGHILDCASQAQRLMRAGLPRPGSPAANDVLVGSSGQ